MLAQFYYAPVEVGKDEDGIANFEDRIFIKITRDVTHTVNRQADEDDFERFPDELKYFERAFAKYEPLTEGLPLEMWPVASPSDVANIKGRGIRTVQQLAKTKLDGVPPHFTSLIQHAVTYIRVAGEAAQTTEKMSALEAENKELKEQVRDLRASVARLTEAVTKVKAA